MIQTKLQPAMSRAKVSDAGHNVTFAGQQVLINVDPVDGRCSNATVLLARLKRFL